MLHKFPKFFVKEVLNKTENVVRIAAKVYLTPPSFAYNRLRSISASIPDLSDIVNIDINKTLDCYVDTLDPNSLSFQDVLDLPRSQRKCTVKGQR